MRRAAGCAIAVSAFLLTLRCAQPAPSAATERNDPPMPKPTTKYALVTLTADLAPLTDKERQMIPLLIDACREMDAIFWMEAYGDRDALLSGIKDAELRRFAEINYGPWDRLKGNEPFLPGVGPKPAGAQYYPADMTKEELEKVATENPELGAALKGQYTVVRRDANGKLQAVAFHEAFAPQIARAAAKLEAAAALAEDAGLEKYLTMRAEALRTDSYQPSDLAWMDMKSNTVDVVIGPIENYEDQLYGFKSTHEGYVLVKDKDWSGRLARYAAFLPDLQKQLPVPAEYKKESPGSDSDLNAYDVVYYAGDCNAGSKTIAINLPNDEEVQLSKGTRKLQLKNAMRAKFDTILEPIADRLIAKDQRQHVTFDAFFANVMFHEVAHGLGIKNTINGKGLVRKALEDVAGPLEEGKADILGLYLVSKLRERKEVPEGELMDNYVTYLAGIFRSVRFGVSSAHGRANLAQFRFFEEHGAFSRDAATGTYRVEPEKMKAAMDALSEKILKLQGDGDLAGTRAFLESGAALTPTLKADLDGLASADIATDIVFRQGTEVLGLTAAR